MCCKRSNSSCAMLTLPLNAVLCWCMTLSHQFDIEHAARFGIEEAILINHIRFWIQKNKANDRNHHDGRWWTYNSVAAFTKIFPYMTAKQIRRAIDSLVAQGVLVKGNYNKNPYDRTAWYAFADPVETWLCPEGQTGEPKQAKRQPHQGKLKTTRGQITEQVITQIEEHSSTSTTPPEGAGEGEGGVVSASPGEGERGRLPAEAGRDAEKTAQSVSEKSGKSNGVR